jgi:hypothetical protein
MSEIFIARFALRAGVTCISGLLELSVSAAGPETLQLTSFRFLDFRDEFPGITMPREFRVSGSACNRTEKPTYFASAASRAFED